MSVVVAPQESKEPRRPARIHENPAEESTRTQRENPAVRFAAERDLRNLTEKPTSKNLAFFTEPRPVLFALDPTGSRAKFSTAGAFPYRRSPFWALAELAWERGASGKIRQWAPLRAACAAGAASGVQGPCSATCVCQPTGLGRAWLRGWVLAFIPEPPFPQCLRGVAPTCFPWAHRRIV